MPTPKGVYPSAAGINSGASTNNPGGRLSAQGWADKSGNLWLFGGSGFDSTGYAGSLNDLWKYNITTGIWAWVAGSSTEGASSVYGTEGDLHRATSPAGARHVRLGRRVRQFLDVRRQRLRFDCDHNQQRWRRRVERIVDVQHRSNQIQWAWMGGVNTAGIAGVYITETPSTTGSIYNTPGSRLWGTSWVDSSGNFWLFGGAGMDSQGTSGYLNDLWKVQLTVQPSGN